MAWITNLEITAHAMSYSVVNDLTKAMKALDGKNNSENGSEKDPVRSGVERAKALRALSESAQ